VREVECGLPGGPGSDGAVRPQYDPARHTPAEREQAKAKELTALGFGRVSHTTVQRMRLTYRKQGLWGLLDHRSTRAPSATGRADERVVAAVREALRRRRGRSKGTINALLPLINQILEDRYGPGTVPAPSQATLYRLVTTLARPGELPTGPVRPIPAGFDGRAFTPTRALRPGEQVQVDTTRLDVLALFDDGTLARPELTIAIDVATRAILAAVLRPSATKAVDAALLLAEMAVPHPARPTWPNILRMNHAPALPHQPLTTLDDPRSRCGGRERRRSAAGVRTGRGRCRTPGGGRRVPQRSVHAHPGGRPRRCVSTRPAPCRSGCGRREGPVSTVKRSLRCRSAQRALLRPCQHLLTLRPNRLASLSGGDMHGDLGADTATAGRIRRADDVLDMQRAARKGGTGPVLRWLAGRTGAIVILMNSAGTPAHPPHTALGDAQRVLTLRAARELAERRLGSIAIDEDGLTCIVLPLDGSRGAAAPLLAAVVPQPAPHELPLLLADATSVLSLSWLAEHTRRKQRRLRIAEAGTREAVLHLLLNGHTSAARQIARALRPALPAMVRVYVIEGLPRRRGQLLEELTDAAQDAWIVTCPVYADHLFMLAPGDGAPAPVWPPELAAACWIGESSTVPLRETATGYAQAFHALAAARGRPERQASFAASPDLAPIIGPAATAWAEALLSPIRTHRARRAQDPDSAELLATTASWLSFHSRATAHLDIHRNTLRARLTCIQELLHLDLHRLADQAAVALALRTVAAQIPPPPKGDATRAGEMLPTLDELLALPRVGLWAQQQFRPVTAPDVPACIAETLTTWLRLDARIGHTATALSISTSAVRKRLTRGEALLKRSLLRSPSAIHDLWLALRALDLAEPSEVPRHFAGLSGST